VPIVTVNVPGLTGPYPHTPGRVPGSIRRTSTVDVVRAGGWEGETVITGMARDTRTPSDGGPPTVDECRLHLTAAGAGPVVAGIESDPAEPRLERLVGGNVLVGFRRAAAVAVPDASPGLLHRLLDDTPLVFMVSAHALMQDDVPRAGPTIRSGHRTADLCAGWQEGGVLLSFVDNSGGVPHSLGPLAPPLTSPSDPLAWHDRPVLPSRATRRTRRLDVVPQGPGRPIRLDAHFRDSYGDLDGVERSLHEYTVEAEVDPLDGTVLSARAVARALPWTECPQAAASAGAVVGRRLDELPDLVRKEFTGITTCTHLNDTLRSLADADGLLAQLGGSAGHAG
jgi:hypothetical protein